MLNFKLESNSFAFSAVFTSWCGPWKETFGDPGVRDYHSSNHSVFIDLFVSHSWSII